MIHHEVPFVENHGKRCRLSILGMVLSYFTPDEDRSMPRLEQLAGYVEGQGTWATQHMLSLADLGFSLRWIEDTDLPRFAKEPKEYMRELFPEQEAYDYQTSHSNIAAEARLVATYLKRGLPFEERLGTAADIVELLDKGWLVGVEVNGMPLAGKEGYGAHSVLAVGYDDASVVIHNPDGVFGSKPNQTVGWSDFEAAWRGFGGSMALQGYYKEANS